MLKAVVESHVASSDVAMDAEIASELAQNQRFAGFRHPGTEKCDEKKGCISLCQEPLYKCGEVA